MVLKTAVRMGPKIPYAHGYYALRRNLISMQSHAERCNDLIE